jgi:hypothetical protein
MRWVITDDLQGFLQDTLPGATDRGRGNFPLSGDLSRLPFQFRLLDDDGEIYYQGRSDDRDSEEAFEPLDWARDHAGCTEIQYLRDGCWETL